MKIIHCADLHLDSKLDSNLPTDLAKERRQELLSTFERLINFAKAENIDKVIIAGDMFDTKRVLINTKNHVLRLIKDNSNIDFFYLSGNHDEDNFIINLEEIPNNLKVFDENFNIYEYENLTISGIKLSKNNYIKFYDNLSFDPSKINILILHGQISKYNSENNPEIINLTELKGKNINYLALGHIHSYSLESLDDNGVYCYAGCLEGRGFDECGVKGFSLIEIENNLIKSKFIPFAKRSIYEIEFDITGKTDWFTIINEIENNLKDINENSLIKLKLIGEYEVNLEKDLDFLYSKLKNLFYFIKIKDNSRLKINANNYVNDISLKGEFIRNVVSDISLSQQEKEDIIMCGIKALNGDVL